MPHHSEAGPPDEAIAVRVQNGEIDAFGELINRYEAKLKRYARKFLSGSDEIEELVQDVFIKAYMNIQSFNPALRFSPWIYRIAHNTYVNELKRKSRVGISFFDPDTIIPHFFAAETADGLVLEKELQQEIDVLLNELPIKYREVVVLHYFEMLSYQEISDVLQIPVTTVGVRLNRARAKLKAAYEAKHSKPSAV